MSEITPEVLAAALGKIVEDECDEEIPFELFTSEVRGNVVEISAHDVDQPVLGHPFTVIVEAGRGVLSEVLAERARQDEAFGPQNWPDGTGLPGDAWSADMARKICQRAAAAGKQKWRHILREVASDVFAKSDTAVLRSKVLEVAAVAAAWVEAIDRRTDAADVPGGGS